MFEEEKRLAENEQNDLDAVEEYARDSVLERQIVVEGFERLEYDSSTRTFTCVVKKGCAPAWRAHNRIPQDHNSFILQFAYLRYQCNVAVREE